MPPILPKGASAEPDLSRRIAEDPNRLLAAAAYWQRVFAALDEHVFESGEFSSDGLRFAAALTDGKLTDLAPETNGLIAATEAGEVFMRSGCLTALAEISRHVDPKINPNRMGDVLNALPAATVSVEEPGLPSLVDADQTATAITLARELFDVIRRFRVCADLARDHDLSVSEMLALYRREGAFAVAPPGQSYRHGPVIRTSDSACRTDRVSLWDSSTVRGGFVTSYDPSTPQTPSAANSESQAFGLLIRNVVCLAGVDTIVLPRLPLGDELIFFMDAADRAKPVPTPLANLRKDFRDRLSRKVSVGATLFDRQRSVASQVNIFDAMCLGLMMLRLEERSLTGETPDGLELLANLEADLTALQEAHLPVLSNGRVFIAADDEGTDTRLSLEIQASWFKSRRALHTLLADRDRPKAPTVAELTPFLGYLRFHIGDPAFVGILIRALSTFDTLRREAGKKPWRNAEKFLDEAEKVSWSLSDTKRVTPWLGHWSTVGSEFAWRHLGLIDGLAGAGIRPPWLKSPPPPSKVMERAATTVRELIALVAQRDMMPSLDTLLRTSPVSVIAERFNLIGFPEVTPRRVALAKVHNFEQLRLVYEQALRDAGLR